VSLPISAQPSASRSRQREEKPLPRETKLVSRVASRQRKLGRLPGGARELATRLVFIVIPWHDATRMGPHRARSRAQKFALGALALSSLAGALSFACGGAVSREQASGASGVAGSSAGSNTGGSAGSRALGGAPNAGSAGAGASGAPTRPCTSDADCPSGGVCQTCADGSAVCPVSTCNGIFCVDQTPTCNCAPAQRDGGASDGGEGFRCTWQSCEGILCPASTSCVCCGGFSPGCICSTNCMTDADCTDPVRPVCDQGVCSDGAFLCCGCP
jgi:hypothetical protein